MFWQRQLNFAAKLGHSEYQVLYFRNTFESFFKRAKTAVASLAMRRITAYEIFFIELSFGRCCQSGKNFLKISPELSI